MGARSPICHLHGLQMEASFSRRKRLTSTQSHVSSRSRAVIGSPSQACKRMSRSLSDSGTRSSDDNGSSCGFFGSFHRLGLLMSHSSCIMAIARSCWSISSKKSGDFRLHHLHVLQGPERATDLAVDEHSVLLRQPRAHDQRLELPHDEEIFRISPPLRELEVLINEVGRECPR